MDGHSDDWPVIRSIRPSDLAALTRFKSRPLVSAAVAKRDLAAPRLPLSSGMLIQTWLSMDENRQTWVSVERSGNRKRIVGLASAKQDGIAWEIDRLLFPPDAESHDVERLLRYIGVVAEENRIQKLFLRVPDSADLVDLVRSAGFYLFASETLYGRHLADLSGTRPAPIAGLRSKAGSDTHNVWELYRGTVPPAVRQAEAMLFDEWKQLHTRRPGTSRRREAVVERNLELVAFLRTFLRGSAGHVELLVRPDSETLLAPLLDAALAQLAGRAPIYVVVREHESWLARELDERGFAPEATYCALVKQLPIRVRQPRLVPVQA